jgi:hypothetical protein
MNLCIVGKGNLVKFYRIICVVATHGHHTSVYIYSIHHSDQPRADQPPCVALFFDQGARKCIYYTKNGTCRYGKKCCFNRPEQVLDV